MKVDGVSKGRLFQRSLSPARLFELEHDFFTLIEPVQLSTVLLDKDMGVRDLFGILRLLRQGFMSHAKNMRLPEEWINEMN
jgi:hypothetical protein